MWQLECEHAENNWFTDILDVHRCRNIVIKPTCFKYKVPTLIDIVISNISKV